MRNRIAAVLACLVVGTFVGSILHAMRGEPHAHDDALDELYAPYYRALGDATLTARAMQRELGVVERMRKRGAL